MGGAGLSSAERAKVEKKIRDLEKKLELYKRQDGNQKAEVSEISLLHEYLHTRFFY